MNATILSFLLVILGGFLSLLQKYTSATSTENKRQNFRWHIFWADNLAMAIFNVIFGICALIAIYFYNDDFRQVVGNINYIGFTWIAVGFAGHYFWQLIFGAIKLSIEILTKHK